MARQKKSTNGGRATIRDVMTAVQGINERIDESHVRIDKALDGQQHLSEQMTELHGSMHELRETTNDRLHEMETDIASVKRPWDILASGWTKTIAFGSGASMLVGLAVKLEVWRFLPF